MANNDNQPSPALAGHANIYYSAYRNSLFAEVEKEKTTDKKKIIHRLVCVATINENAGRNRHAEVTEYYEQFLSKFQGSLLTGILLVYPNCVIHVLESSSEVLTQILKDLSDMENGSVSFLKDSRILVVSHCIRDRMFPYWGHRILNLPLSLKDASPQIRPVELLVPDTLALIYKLCASLLKQKVESQGHGSLKQTLSLEEETIIHLCQNQVLHSPTTFLQAYTKPVNLLMDSELVWPTPRPLYWWRE